MDKMREEFEAWANGYNVYRSETGGHYVDSYVNGMWISWQASRAALCVEVSNAYQQGGMMADYLVESALEEAGVSYK